MLILEELWRRSGGVLEELWRRCGGGLEEVWGSFGGGLEALWRRSRGALEEVWRRVAIGEVRNCRQKWVVSKSLGRTSIQSVDFDTFAKSEESVRLSNLYF